MENEVDTIRGILLILEESVGTEILEKFTKKYKYIYEAKDILDERERRVEKQQHLVEKYNLPLITIRVNYPGVQKNNYVSLGIFSVLCRRMLEEFKEIIVYKDFDISAEGPTLTLLLSEEAYVLKEKSVKIEEENPLGRFADIDVYNHNKPISRREIGMLSRKCYVCEDEAHSCVRQSKHSIDELQNYIKRNYEAYLESIL